MLKSVIAAGVLAAGVWLASGKESPRLAAGVQKLMDGFPETVRTSRNAPLPANLEFTDIVAEKPPVPPPYDTARLRAHQDFDKAALNRRGVVATGSGHYVMRDKPELVTNEIAAMDLAAQ
jgi:pimeloyl-ACP methyl ester carboxylesterase